MFKVDSSRSLDLLFSKDTDSAKVDKFPGLHGYPSHFGINLRLSDEQITSIVHRVNFLLPALPAEFQSPVWNLLGYIAHLKGSEAESTEYYRTVLRLDPFNIVATSDLAHQAEQAGRREEKNDLENRINIWLKKHHIVKRKYIALAHLDIAFFYFYSGLRQATMYHLTTALSIYPGCVLSRFYYSLFSYLADGITYHFPKDVNFHSSSLNFVSESKPSIPVVEYLIWIIETKSAFLPREKTAVLEDKLQSFDKGSSCPLIRLFIAKELYNLQFYQAAMDIAKRSLQRHVSAAAHHLMALCQKKIYEREVEQSLLDNQAVSSAGDDTQLSPNGPQIILEETRHESKHQSSALLLPVRSIDQASCYSGRSKMSAMRKGSPKESEVFTDYGSDLNEEDGAIDPKIMEMFENVRCACILDPFDVSQLMLLTEVLVLCHKIDLAIVYLHEALRRCSGGEKVMTYFRLAVCYIDQKNAEQGANYLRLYRDNGGETEEDYVNLVVKLADTLMKMKQPLQAREWIQVMEQNQHPSCEHFVQRLKRLVAKDKHLLDAFNLDNKNNRNRKGMGSLRRKMGSTAS
ncbi:uncharacterized protein LOC134825589 isoform X2 [Bolinopsis microptera]|uniref:uncharacterized protein LOC134825589 isoform X2 n=1 Tax=Bolinopsis microptera TaxID=2820187 RepID=UPI00307AF99A